MSEYQYYEFIAIDRPLSEVDRRELRKLSTRARITATTFANSYGWGDFKGDPAQLMRRWFDLHLYLANWGSRRLMIRLPARVIDRHLFDAFLGKVDCAELTAAGENLILDVARDELEFEDWDDGSGWLAALTPLRAEMLAGDLRVLYLLWLTAVEADQIEADEPEPMPGIGPMTATLEAFAEFFNIDPDLVQAAAERSAVTNADELSADAVRMAITAMPDREKTRLLVLLFENAPHVASQLRADIRERLRSEAGAPPVAARTAGELRARTEAIHLARERSEADKAAAEHIRQTEEAEKLRRARLDAFARRGESVWREVEAEIARRNAAGYGRAAGILFDLKAIAEERGTVEEFLHRFRAIRTRHAGKIRFVERLAATGLV